MTEVTKLPETQPQKKQTLQVVQSNRRGVVINSIDDAARLAEGLVRSGMIPESYKVMTRRRDDQGNSVEVVDTGATTARAMISIMKGIEVGLPPITSIEWIIPVNGRSCVWGDGALSLIQNSEHYEHHEEKLEGKPKTDEWIATCSIKRRGIDSPIVRTFSWAQAKQANLTGKGKAWPAYPERMLQMRARALAMRDGFADVLCGLSIAEEVRDIEIEQEAVKPDVATQQDPFTMAALTNSQPATSDFSLMGAKQAETVVVTEEAMKPVSELKEICQTCNGKGLVEDLAGKGPCPDCAV